MDARRVFDGKGLAADFAEHRLGSDRRIHPADVGGRPVIRPWPAILSWSGDCREAVINWVVRHRVMAAGSREIRLPQLAADFPEDLVEGRQGDHLIGEPRRP